MPEASSPFDYRAPVQDPQAFIGRQSELDLARESIERKICISFVGEPYAGLTSFLNRIMAPDFAAQCELGSDELLLVRINCEEFSSPLPLLIDLLGKIAPKMPIPKLPDWRPLFGRLIGAVTNLRQTLIAILFDNFECIGANALFVDFIDALRGLTIGNNMLLFTATHRELYRACHMDVVASPFCNIFKVRYLGPFDQQEALTYISAFSEAHQCDLAPYAEPILATSGRWPYFMSIACDIYQQALCDGLVSEADALTAKFIEVASPALERIWECLEEEERQGLLSLSQGNLIDENLSNALSRKGHIEGEHILSLGMERFIKTKNSR